MKPLFCLLLVAGCLLAGGGPARASIVWDWTAGGGAHRGQIITDGSSLAAGTFTILDASFTTSSFMPLGSVSDNTYELPGAGFGTTGPYTLTWDGSAVVSIDPTTHQGVAGLVIGNNEGSQWAIFGGDAYGWHAPETWHFQSEGGSYSYADDMSITPQPLPAPEIAVQAPGSVELESGSIYDFGSVGVGTQANRSFTILNAGNLDLSGLSITSDGAAAFSATQPILSTVPGPNGSTSFTVSFAPGTGGDQTGTLHIASDDADEDPFDIELKGRGVADCTVSAWSEWSACCNGSRTRTRTIVTPASGGGAACPALVETQSCATPVPAITITQPLAGSTVAINAAVPLAATFTDAAGYTHTGTWTFGSGTTPATIVEPAGAVPGSATGSCSFAAAGDYTITLTLASSCGGSATASVGIRVGSTVVAFPQTPVLDNFNRRNGRLGGLWIGQTSSFEIKDKQLRKSGGDAYIEWCGAKFGPDQEAFVTLRAITNTASEHNLLLKMQGSSSAYGHIKVSYSAPYSKIVVSTFTPPRSWRVVGTLPGVALAAGDRFGARALRDGRVQVYRNGALLGTVSVGSWTYASRDGRIGISWGRATTTRADDFGGGTLPTAAVVAASPASAQGQLAPPVDELPRALSLSNAFPNPTHGRVLFTLTLPTEQRVSLSVLDVQGRQVWSSPEQRYSPGVRSLSWEGQTAEGTAATGVYFARVRAGGQVFLRRIALVR